MRAIFLLLALALAQPTIAETEVPQACRSMVAAIGAPKTSADVNDRAVLCRGGYVLLHDAERKTPVWVVERLTPSQFKGSADRKKLRNPFTPDPDLAKGERAELADYRAKSSKGRKFDRGHMAPAADMKFSEQAMRESFYLSNMAPQQGIGLNRHIWADLEEIAREWTCDRSELYVITGPIYEDDDPDLLGRSEVAVPTAFFKVVYDPTAKRVIAFILPNQKVDKHDETAWEALKPYRKKLSEVENRTGMKLLTGLQPRDRQRLRNLRSTMWPVRRGCND